MVFVEDIYSWIIKDLGSDLAILGPSDILWAYTIISCVFAIAATIPVVAYQTWEFIASALTKEERKVTQNVYPRIIQFFSGSRINYDYSSGFRYTRHYSFTGSLRIKCHHIQDCL